MKLPCAVIRDLLELYAEKMVETETQALVEAHLTACPECRRRMEDIGTEQQTPVEASAPLRLIRKQIRRRRWMTAAMAALCVLVIACVWFYRTESMKMLPWQDGLIEVQGIETVTPQDRLGRQYYMTAEQESCPPPHEYTGEALVLRANGQINGFLEEYIEEDDGSVTVVIQCASWRPLLDEGPEEDHELVIYPVPDRLLYGDMRSKQILWGRLPDGGTQAWQPTALMTAFVIAAALGALLGALWLVFRRRRGSRLLRQLFFMPAAWGSAQLLLKGGDTGSFFLDQDLFSMVFMSAAVYMLFTLAWQSWLQHRQEM